MLKFRDVLENNLNLNDLYRSNRTAAQDCAHITIASGGGGIVRLVFLAYLA
jgi:hypothetical protein